ncbi:MAG TPA: substrate-binding domain-containing protein, partial [Miltoncostaea sp.]|nr:substrate-binding domain-containing protein [Miltoncostaea sp.]
MSLPAGPRRARTLAIALTATAAFAVATAAPAVAATKLSLVAYSTPQEAYDALIPAFQKTPAGRGVTFSESYGASGDQSRAVANGLPADVVAFSL